MRTDGDWIKSCVSEGGKSGIVCVFLRYVLSFVEVIRTIHLIVYLLIAIHVLYFLFLFGISHLLVFFYILNLSGKAVSCLQRSEESIGLSTHVDSNNGVKPHTDNNKQVADNRQ